MIFGMSGIDSGKDINRDSFVFLSFISTFPTSRFLEPMIIWIGIPRRSASLNFTPVKQNKKNSTTHFSVEIENKTKIDLNKKYKALDFINLIRAKTFWNGPSLKINKDDSDYYLSKK